MVETGALKVYPDHQDYSLLHTFGALDFDTKGLPENFSIYSGQPIPNQNDFDKRFVPALPPMPFSCTGQTGSFESGLQDGTLYDPRDLWQSTPPGGDGGRDIRAMLQVLIDRGPRKADGTLGPKRSAYFNCYGAGKIDDFDAARIALWINQQERRGVYIGSFWYPEFENPVPGSGTGSPHPGHDGILPTPSFDTRQASLHNHLGTGWRTINGRLALEDISWQGEDFANAGIDYIYREDFNALMAQPYTGAFTITKLGGKTPVPIGVQAYIDHLVYFIRNLFHV